MFSVTNVKGHPQVTELQLVNSSGLDTKILVLCDTASSNPWVPGSLADKLGLHGKALKLTVKGINTEEVAATRVVELTVKPKKNIRCSNDLPSTLSLKRVWTSAQKYLIYRSCRRLTHT